MNSNVKTWITGLAIVAAFGLSINAEANKTKVLQKAGQAVTGAAKSAQSASGAARAALGAGGKTGVAGAAAAGTQAQHGNTLGAGTQQAEDLDPSTLRCNNIGSSLPQNLKAMVGKASAIGIGATACLSKYKNTILVNAAKIQEAMVIKAEQLRVSDVNKATPVELEEIARAGIQGTATAVGVSLKAGFDRFKQMCKNLCDMATPPVCAAAEGVRI